MSEIDDEGEITAYNRFPDKDFPPAPWSWLDNNGYNSNTYIFCGVEPEEDMDFLEIPEDCSFMAIDDKKLAAFIVDAVNSHASHVDDKQKLQDALKSSQDSAIRLQLSVDVLRDETTRLREALKTIADHYENYFFEGDKEYQGVIVARAALHAVNGGEL